MKKPVVTDLTKIEGNPTSKADLLEEREDVTFEVILSDGKRINATAPTWLPSGIAPVITRIVLSSVMIPSAFAGLGVLVLAPGWVTVTAALISFCVIVGSGMWIINRLADALKKNSRDS
ncbi:hypothetical protein [Nonomuraea aurantiaca]|uniref:hypothetical protein n=1 Tax=Nonomuraea aurantiaca TaxID=2878562 RepID=UPI001CD98C43|nr:hypothetical protein [Nonomuraea aurantiaca]MCA2227886.1 hypothetical protein [Nonomuraea aurantiaca]